MDHMQPIETDLSFINTLEVAKHPSFYFLDILEKANLSAVIDNVSAVSRELGISRKGFYDFIHGSTGISPIMAVRLAAFFKKYLPDNKTACDHNYWWTLHSNWYFQNEIRKLTYTSPKFSYNSVTASDSELFVADNDNNYGN